MIKITSLGTLWQACYRTAALSTHFYRAHHDVDVCSLLITGCVVGGWSWDLENFWAFKVHRITDLHYLDPNRTTSALFKSQPTCPGRFNRHSYNGGGDT